MMLSDVLFLFVPFWAIVDSFRRSQSDNSKVSEEETFWRLIGIGPCGVPSILISSKLGCSFFIAFFLFLCFKYVNTMNCG